VAYENDEHKYAIYNMSGESEYEMKKTGLIFFVIFLLGTLLFRNIKQNVILNNEESKSLDYYFKIKKDENINSVLSRQRYYYTTDINKKYIAVITYNDDTASMKQFLTENGGEIKLKIPYGSLIAISLPANRTISYQWTLKNRNYDSILHLYDYSWIRIPYNVFGVKDGENYDRQNFYFKVSDEGSDKINIRYESMSEESVEKDDYFEINFEITIQK